jgi:NAD(P)-dependent dehydrogenase (short-subunit alcohol dehydrogenase family)
LDTGAKYSVPTITGIPGILWEEGEMSRTNELNGQVALITGANRGIGLAIAERLGDMGARLAICARNSEKLNQAALSLQNRGAEIFSRMADVTDLADILKMVNETRAALGPIDILVNNAGIGHFGPFHDLSEDQWDKTLNTNLKSVFLMSRAVAPEMIQRRTGHIINIASLAGKNAFAGGSIYCASKFGLMGLTACMAEDLRNYNIRVSAVCPGSVSTEFSLHQGRDHSKLLQPVDVAHAVAALVTQGPTNFMSEILLRPLAKPQ